MRWRKRQLFWIVPFGLILAVGIYKPTQEGYLLYSVGINEEPKGML